MKGISIEYHHGSLVRKTIPSRNYDTIFNLRRYSESITKNKFRLSLNKHNTLLFYYSFQKRSENYHKCVVSNRFHNYEKHTISGYSINKYDNCILQELKIAKDYFDKNKL